MALNNLQALDVVIGCVRGVSGRVVLPTQTLKDGGIVDAPRLGAFKSLVVSDPQLGVAKHNHRINASALSGVAPMTSCSRRPMSCAPTPKQPAADHTLGNAFEQEASRNFDYRTLVWRSELLFLPPAWRLGDAAWFWVNPLAGVAAGGIPEAPDDALDTGSLFRVVGGVSATLELPNLLCKEICRQRRVSDPAVISAGVRGRVDAWRGLAPMDERQSRSCIQ